LGPSYADAEQRLVDSLELASSRVVDLNERALQQRANAALVANFVGLLPKSGVAEQLHGYRNNTLNGHLQTKDERHIPALISSTVWLSTKTEHTSVLMPYYVVGVNSFTGSLLLGKPLSAPPVPSEPNMSRVDAAGLKSTDALKVVDELNAMPLVMVHLGKEGGRMARRRTQKVIASADRFYAEVSPEPVRSIYDPKSEDLKLTPYTKTSFILPESTTPSRLLKVEYLSDKRMMKYNVVPTMNLMAMRFGVSAALQALYEPTVDLVKPTPSK
jgi:hypothetical protein